MKQLITLTVITAISTAVAGQDAPSPHRTTVSTGVPIQETLTVGQMMQNSGGSLYRAGMTVRPDASRQTPPPGIGLMFVPAPEPKVLKKHDLVTIIIKEESEVTSDGTTDLKKNSDFNAVLNQLPKFANGALHAGVVPTTPAALQATANRDTKGEAHLSRSDKFDTRIAAEVVDVKPNGTIAIQARKTEKHDDEEQELILTGVCRGTDVTPDNSVYSWQIYNLQIVNLTNGAVTDTNKRGIIPKIVDTINPF
ncbi:MAG: flagellar basal body L-ring protein FlgH [Tepidisphaeraceae bacterium]|jgi:flagellar L-ring protein precursor FlgH